jgi:hypothetical protein
MDGRSRAGWAMPSRLAADTGGRSIIPDFWQVGVVLKPEGLVPQTSHRAWPPGAYSEKLPLCSWRDYVAVADGRESDNLIVEVIN